MLEAIAIAGNETPTRALRVAAAGACAAPSIDRPSDPPPARIALSHYEVGEQIGAGGMGTVYKATHMWLGRTVAVKFIAKEALADPDAARRFGHEIQAIGKLDHSNIVRASDAGCAGGSHYLVTEFVDGSDLARLVKTAGPLKPADACEVIRQAALGLQHAHEQQLVHRDIKPSNLLLSRDGTVKLVDFGLARLASNQTALTTTGQMIGTLDYLAPEQAGDARRVDIRSDIYSLGCTFYFLLTGRAPFSGAEYETPASKIKAHLADQPPLPRGNRGRIPSKVLACLERMMAKSADDRYQKPAAIASVLAPLARGANMPRLISNATGGSTDCPDKTAGSPLLETMRHVVTAPFSAAAWLVRRIFFRRDSFRSESRREPIISIGGIIGLVLIGLVLSHFSCIPRGMPPRFDPRDMPPGTEVHYYRIGPAPADQP